MLRSAAINGSGWAWARSTCFSFSEIWLVYQEDVHILSHALFFICRLLRLGGWSEALKCIGKARERIISTEETGLIFIFKHLSSYKEATCMPAGEVPVHFAVSEWFDGPSVHCKVVDSVFTSFLIFAIALLDLGTNEWGLCYNIDSENDNLRTSDKGWTINYVWVCIKWWCYVCFSV